MEVVLFGWNAWISRYRFGLEFTSFIGSSARHFAFWLAGRVVRLSCLVIMIFYSLWNTVQYIALVAVEAEILDIEVFIQQ